jgi:phosphoglycerate dehydrogenase-like enzyme
MKAIFISSMVNTVYTAEQRQKIAELTEMMPEIVEASNFDSFDLSDVEVIFSTWGMMNFTPEQLDRMPKLKAVFYAAGATDYFARPLLQRGIRVFSAWLANAVPVAEFTVAQILLSMKNYFNHTAALKCKENWQRDKIGPGAYGETVALIGAGAISTKVQELLKGYALNVIVIPSRKERRTISLEEAFRTAYVVSNHLPNREDNQKVLTKEMFASMRQGATFINTGRGAQVDEEGMCEVLKERPDLTALLDVTCPEPPENDSPLYKLPNVHLSAHIAGSWNDEFHRMADYMIEEYNRYVAGEEALYEITEKVLMTSN